MGQQQLLLVILVTIIVGIATVVAINTFGSAADNANLDAVNQDIASIAAAAQGYYMKPDALNGGGNTFTGIDFSKIANPGQVPDADNTISVNENGTYKLTVAAQKLTVAADPASGAGYTAGTSGSAANTITVDVLRDGLDRDQNGTLDSQE